MKLPYKAGAIQDREAPSGNCSWVSLAKKIPCGLKN